MNGRLFGFACQWISHTIISDCPAWLPARMRKDAPGFWASLRICLGRFTGNLRSVSGYVTRPRRGASPDPEIDTLIGLANGLCHRRGGLANQLDICAPILSNPPPYPQAESRPVYIVSGDFSSYNHLLLTHLGTQIQLIQAAYPAYAARRSESQVFR